MSGIHAEIASHIVQPGMYAVRLYGGPWDGKEVGVRVPDPPFVRVNGPRHGQHFVWITHLYQRREGRYEFISTEVVPLSAWRINLDVSSSGIENAEQSTEADRPSE
jgi:hypothetical protein